MGYVSTSLNIQRSAVGSLNDSTNEIPSRGITDQKKTCQSIEFSNYDCLQNNLNIRSAHSRVHKSTLAHRCVLHVVSAFGFQKKAYQSFATSRLQSRRFACALPRIAQRKSINIRSAHSRVHKSTLARPCVLRVVSAFGFQKKTYQSFLTSRLQSRRFACAVPRIAQRKSINIRSAHSRVHKSTLARRCVLRVVSAFGFQKKAYQSFVTSRLQSRQFACAVPRIAQRKSINIRSAHSRVHKSTLARPCVLRVVSAFGFQKKAYQSFVTSRLQSR